jgi:DNA polymerase III delta prime subunit
MDDMDRNMFLNSQEWLCEINEHQQKTLFDKSLAQKIFDGHCCFQSNFMVEDNYHLFLYFESSEKFNDFVQLKLDLYLLELPPMQQVCQEPSEPKQKKRKIESQTGLLVGCFDERWYLIDHTQIERIITPNLETSDQETPFAAIRFYCVTLRLYYRPDTSKNTKTTQKPHQSNGNAKKLKETVDQILSKLKSADNLADIIRQHIPPQQDSSTISEELLLDKYRQWIRFINTLNERIMTEPMQDDKNHTNEIAANYKSSLLTNSQVRSFLNKNPIFTSILQAKQKTLKKINLPNKIILVEDIKKDFAIELDMYEDILEKDILSDIEQIFSFSQTQSVPSNDSLQALEKKMEKYNQVVEQSVLISALLQKHFDI